MSQEKPNNLSPEAHHSETTNGSHEAENSHFLCLKRLVVNVRYLNGLVALLLCSIVCFHPWFMQLFEKALSILPLMLLVLIFVYVVNPLVGFILTQVRKLPGAKFFSYQKSLIVTYLLLLFVVALLISAITPKLYDELQMLAFRMPEIGAKASHFLSQYRHSHFDALPQSAQERIVVLVNQIGSKAGEFLQSGLQYAGAISSAVFWVLSAIVMVPLISYYMMADGQDIIDWLIRLAPRKKQKTLHILLPQIHEAMQSFLKGQAILCGAIGLLTTLAMALVLPDYCIALGIVAGITEAIPVVGPILGAIPAVIIALAIPGKGGLGLAVIVAVIYIVIQQLENTILVPKIMGSTLGLHPLSLTLGLIIFGNMFGFWGVLLATPIVASIKILVVYFCRPDDYPSLAASNDETTPSSGPDEKPASEPIAPVQENALPAVSPTN